MEEREVRARRGNRRGRRMGRLRGEGQEGGGWGKGREDVCLAGGGNKKNGG